MKIAITSITYEGVMRNKMELIKKLIENGHDVYIIAPYSDEADTAYIHGIYFYPVSIEPHGKNPICEYKIFKQYKDLYKILKPDVVLNLTIKPNVYSGIACQKMDIPYIGTINGIGDAVYNGGFLSIITLFLLKLGLKNANFVFFQNSKNKSLFLSKRITTSEKALLVPGSGINVVNHPYEEYPKNINKTVFTFIGRVTKDKGIYELLEAIKVLKTRRNDFIVNVVGGCPETFVDLITDANNEGLINYIGKVKPQEIHNIIKNSHAVVLPSYHEGIANVLLEGGAAGRPIIASFAEGCEETFEDGISGLGFKPKSTEELVNAMEKFLDMTNEEKRVMGLKAHQKIVKEFNRDLVDSAYIDAINKIGGNKVEII